MQVKMRHIDDGEAAHFTEIHHTELDGLIEFIKRSGGVQARGDYQPFHSYQIVFDEGEAYVEILIGEGE
jgi:hypothetical protein